MRNKQTPSAAAPANQLAKITPIRTETVLCQYPIHHLDKGEGSVKVTLTGRSAEGAELATTWKVSANADYGHPGVLAYKIDTLVVNRVIDAHYPDVPPVIRIADSLRHLSELLGKEETGDTAKVKHALYQNAFAAITSQLKYIGKDRTRRLAEFGATRYTVVFIGETLPNGEKADAIYLILNPVFRELLHNAKRRPLDYDYLAELPPLAQRWYELLSFQIFAALNLGNPRARYTYSELCQRGPFTRSCKWDIVRQQLRRIHKPHLESGYLAKVEFEKTTDKDGQPDWVLWYTPGPKAQAEFRQFNTKEGRAELNPQPLRPPAAPAVKQLPPAPPAAFDPAQEALVARLSAAGVAKAVARKLVSKDAAECERQLAALPARENVKNQGAYLVQAIREHYPLPAAPAKAARQAAPAPGSAEQRQQQQQEQEARDRQNACELAAQQRYLELAPEDLQQRQARAQTSFEEAARADFQRQDVWAIVLKGQVIAQLAEELAAAALAR